MAAYASPFEPIGSDGSGNHLRNVFDTYDRASTLSVFSSRRRGNMSNLTRRSLLRGSLGVAAVAALSRPHIARRGDDRYGVVDAGIRRARGYLV